ncbi:MAG: hypothetical protein KC421_27745, partial [Anaerolineales bacterium]|nr:hypothetical protein [Anaerolineales bacterium]
RRKRPFSQFVRDGLWLSVPLLVVLGLFVGLFVRLSPNFIDLVLGHHLAQGSGEATGVIWARQLGLYAEYVSFYPVLVPVAIVSGIIGIVRNDVRRRWVWQFVMVASFLVLSREFGQRHFMFLLPVMALLAAWLIAEGINGRYRWWGRIFAVVALIAIILPFIQADAYRAQWDDQVTQPILDLITDNTQPNDTILADDIGLAYYSGRPTTYSGAALSHGAITSRQITAELLIDEIVQDNVRMVIVDTSLLTGNHMVFLDDYPRFHRFLEYNFERLGNFRRDFQELDVWLRAENRGIDANDYYSIANTDGTRFGESLFLHGYTVVDDTVQPGDTLAFTLFWTADAPDDHYWSVFTHLISPDGQIVGQHDKVPYDGLFPTSHWQSGIVVDDRFAIAVPPDAAPGEYRIGVGMYDWITGEQLPLFTPDGEPIPDNRTVIAQPITILP